MRASLQTHRGAVVQVWTSMQLLHTEAGEVVPQRGPPRAPNMVGVPESVTSEAPEIPVTEIAAQTLVEATMAKLSRAEATKLLSREVRICK